VDVYRHQLARREGRIGAKNAREDFRRVFVCRVGAQLHPAVQLEGRVYWLKVYEIPEAAAATRARRFQAW